MSARRVSGKSPIGRSIRLVTLITMLGAAGALCAGQDALLAESTRALYRGGSLATEALAEHYRVQGQLERAIRVFQRAAPADPKLPDIHLALAEIYLEQGKQADARQEIEQELAIVSEGVAALALKQKLEASETQPKRNPTPWPL